jgi:RimJ/RimL family protein N-acetyltransferase
MFQWMTDPEVSINIGLRTEPSLEKTHSWLRRALEDRGTRAYAILLDGRHVGNLIFDRIDDYLATARLSIYIGEREARGRGVGSKALRLGLTEAFERLSLNKVWLIVHVHNTRAIQTYLRAGFVMEGIVRDEFRLNGQLVPAFYMGILSADFTRNPVESA